MREIKFRYRLKLVSDDWGNYKEGDIDTFYISLNDKTNGLYRFSIDERWDVVSCDEWTGLKDKNGNEIYEGDIVEYDNGTKAKVIFKEGCFCGYDGYAVSSDEAYTLLSLEDVPFNGGFEIKVIGNIHENSNLLVGEVKRTAGAF